MSFKKSWLTHHKIHQSQPFDETMMPIVKFHPNSLSSYYPYEKCDLGGIFQSIMGEIEKTILNENLNLDVELRFFGRIVKNIDKISFVCSSDCFTKLYQNFNVQTLNKFPMKKLISDEKFKLPSIRGKDMTLDRPMEVLVAQDNTNYEKKHPKNLKSLKLGNEIVKKTHEGQENSMKTKMNTLENSLKNAYQKHLNTFGDQSNSETFQNFDFDKNKYFSRQFTTPYDIWHQSYTRNSQMPTELPKVLEKHSQTKAKPVALMFNSLSVSSRIAINYTPLAKYLYLDPSSKKITILFNNENNIFAQNKIKTCEESVDLKSTINEINSDDSDSDNEEMEKYNKQADIQMKFNNFVMNLIDENEVIDFSGKLLENLTENSREFLIGSPEQESVELFLKDTFAEIKNDFKFALKKGIFYYLLKEKDERNRLGLPYLLEQPEEYGALKNAQLVVKGNRGIVRELSNYMNENLMLFSNETNQIMQLCSEFENQSFFNLDIKDDGIGLFDFLDLQRNQYTKLKSFIAGDWIRDINEVYKVKAKQIKKRQLKIFVDTMGVVISRQLRQLTERSLIQLKDFFSKFDNDCSDSVLEKYSKYLSPKHPLEKFFLVVGVKEKENGLVFDNPVESTIEELVDQIKDVVRNTGNVCSTDNHFFRGGKCAMDPISLNEPFVENSIESIKKTMANNFQRIEDFQTIFKDFYYLFEEKTGLSSAIVKGVNQDALLELFKKYSQLEAEVVEKFPSEIPFNMVKINACSVKEQIVAIPIDLKKTIEEHVYSQIETLSNHIIKTLKSNFESLTTRIDNVEKLIEKEVWLNNFKMNEFPALQSNYANILKWYDQFSLSIRFSSEKLRNIFEAKGEILLHKTKIKTEEDRIRTERDTLEKRLVGRKGFVNTKASELSTKIEGFRSEGRDFRIQKMILDLTDAKTNLENILKDIESINKEEELMGFPKSEFENVKSSASSIYVFDSFWRNVAEWVSETEKWDKTIIFKLDIQKVSEKCASIHKNISKALKDFALFKMAGPEPVAYGETKLALIEKFQKDFDLVKCFCNEGLQSRHWSDINKYLQANGIDVRLENGGTYSIATFKDLNLNSLQSGISEISNIATKEWVNEKYLRAVESQYDASVFELKEYKYSTEMYVLSNEFSEDTILMINNHLLRIESMKSSPYATVFKDKIAELQKLLSTAKSVVQLWIKLQVKWIYLEPIFNTDDVVKSLPHESMRFKEVQVSFRGFVLARKRNPGFKELSFDADLVKKLTSLIEMLENVDKNLENYLDKKRSEYPRLYFLSSEALIQLVACAKTPSKLSKHLKVLFGGLGKLKVNPNDEIEGLVAPDGEQLIFTEKIAIRAFKGHIEKWLERIEETIIYEIKKQLILGLQDFAKQDKETFLSNRLGQIVLNVIMTAWTFETEGSINVAGNKGLYDNISEIDKYIQQMAQLVPRTQTPHDLLTIENVIAANIHNRSVLEHLIEHKIQKVSDFLWESQLRHYLGEQNNDVEKFSSKVQMMYSAITYGYEFVGNCNRLVRTPMTDKCFRAFFVASKVFFGNCLEGPSATGKTETIKEFSRLTAKFMLVVNCSEMMDTKTTLRIVKGLAISGNWACFDEFNRVDMSVMSALSQQLQRIQLALNQGKNELLFNGSMIKLKSNFMIFVTANSGFSETTDLPENVKFLFRSTALVKPDTRVITETKLSSAGFLESEDLTHRLINLCEFNSWFFSSHSHYDFSLRTIMRIIKEAFHLKLFDDSVDEEGVLVQSILRILGLKFTTSDFKQLKEIVTFFFGKEKLSLMISSMENQSIFDKITISIETSNKQKLPWINTPLKISSEEDDLVEELSNDQKENDVSNDKTNKTDKTDIAASNDAKDEKVKSPIVENFNDFFSVSTNKNLIGKIVSVREMMRVSHSLLFLGETMSGKSHLMDMLGTVDGEVKIIKINPCSMSFEDLFGCFESNGVDWKKGVLQKVFDDLTDQSVNENCTLLVFDGFLHSSWTENLNTLLDDSARIVFPNGDIYSLPDKTNVVFETDSISDVSPATISRCGIMYFDSDNLSWKTLMKSWINGMTFLPQPEIEKMEVFFLSVYEPILKSLRTMECCRKLNDNQLFKSFALLAHDFMIQLTDSSLIEKIESKDRLVLIDQCFLFSLIWSLGMIVVPSQLKQFDLLVKKSIKTPDKSVPQEVWKQFRKIIIPETGSIFDQQLVFTSNDKEGLKLTAIWKNWNDSLTEELQIVSYDRIPGGIIRLPEHSRYLQLIDKFNIRNQSVILSGSIGCGKSIIMELFKQKIDNNSVLIVETSFLRGTDSKCFNFLLNKSFTRKLNQSIHYPLNDKSKVLFIIEDINLGSPSVGNVQMNLEYIKFLQETSSFYDLEDSQKTLKKVILPSIIGSVTTPEEKSGISSRVMSHFSLITVRDIEEDSLIKIFSLIFNKHFDDSFNSLILQKLSKIILSIVDVVKESKKKFCKTKSTRNLFSSRNMFRIVQGICSCNASVFKSVEDIFKLFVSESWEHVGNRLSTTELQSNFLCEVLRPIFVKQFGTNFELAIGFNDSDDETKSKLVLFSKKLMFTKIKVEEFNPKGFLVEVNSKGKFINALETFQNNLILTDNTRVPLNLFGQIVESVVRIGNVISSRNGHLMIIHSNESVFQRTLEFVCSIHNSELIDVKCEKDSKVNSWKECLIDALIKTGRGLKVTVYLKEDNLNNSDMMDWIGLCLNNMNVLELLNQEQIEAVFNPLNADDPKDRIRSEVIECIQCNLHFVISLSSDNSVFDKLLCERPSLISCFQTALSVNWPEELMRNTANACLSTLLESTDIQISFENTFVEMHKIITVLYQEFSSKKNIIWINKSENFEKLLKNFSKVFSETKLKLTSKIDKLKLGLEMLTECEEVVTKQHEKLDALKPILSESSERVSLLVASIEDKTEAVKSKGDVLALEEKLFREETENIKAISDECQYEVNSLQPELDKARDELMKITKSDLDFLNQMKNPAMPVQYALQSLCLLLNVKPEIKRDAESGRHNPDWWTTSKLLLNTLTVETLLKFDERDVTDDQVFKKLESFLEDPKIKENLDEKTVKFSSPAAHSLFSWVNGQYNLHLLNQNLIPKRKALEEANSKLKSMKTILTEKTKEFEETQLILNKLKSDLSCAREEKLKAEKDIEILLKKVDFAKNLLEVVPDEKKRWEEMYGEATRRLKSLYGDTLLTVGFMTYLGILDYPLRIKAISKWRDVFMSQNLIDNTYPVHGSLSVLFSPIKLLDWHNKGLSNDRFSIDNAIAIDHFQNNLLVIDPHDQGREWIVNYFQNKTLKITNTFDPSFESIVSQTMINGGVLLINNLQLPFDNTIHNLISKKSLSTGLTNDNIEPLKIHDEFQLVMISKSLPVDNSLSEYSSFNVLNYEVTKEGLSEQILSHIITSEKPQLKKSLSDCQMESFKNSVELESIENQLLEVLSGDKTTILEDQSVIGVLMQSKTTNQFIKEKQSQVNENYSELNNSKKEYQELSSQLATLFIISNNLIKLNPFYAVNLDSFIDCLSSTLSSKSTSRSLSSRLNYIEKTFVIGFCKSMIRGLFDNDKVTFVFIMVILLDALQNQRAFDQSLMNFILVPSESVTLFVNPPQLDWMSKAQWHELNYLASCFHKFKEVCSDENLVNQIGNLIKSDDIDLHKVPEIFEGKLDSLEKYCLLKTMHPQHWYFITEQYIDERMGDHFLKDILQTDFSELLKFSTLSKPVLLMIKDGEDPMSFLSKKLTTRSNLIERVIIGKNQTDSIVRAMDDCIKNGSWMLLQCFNNEPTIWSVLVQKMNAVRSPNFEISKNFRLIISCTSADHIPSSVLFNSLHFAIEEPINFKQAMKSILEDDLLNNQEFHDSCDRKKLLQQTSITLCAIHACLQEKSRKIVGGFNRKYKFTSNDFKISLQQLQALLTKTEDIFSLEIIHRFMADFNYGSQITNEIDQRLLNAIIHEYFTCEGLKNGKLNLNPNNNSSPVVIPDTSSREKVIEFIDGLKDDFDTEIENLRNEKNTQTQLETHQYFTESLGIVFATVRESSSYAYDFLNAKLMFLFQGLPSLLDTSLASKRFPQNNNFVNIVLLSEIEKFNSVLSKIKTDFEMVMESSRVKLENVDYLQNLLNCFVATKIPKDWKYWDFSQQLSLNEFISCLIESGKFFQQTISLGKLPEVIFIGAFSHPKAFIQAIKMNYANEQSLDLETVCSTYSVFSSREPNDNRESIVLGPFNLHYADFDDDSLSLIPKNKLSENRSIQIKMQLSIDVPLENNNVVLCPVFTKQIYLKSPERKITCFDHLFDASISCDGNLNYWIKSGVKLITFKN